MTSNTCHKSDECRGTLIDMALDDTAHCDALKLAEVIRHANARPHFWAATRRSSQPNVHIKDRDESQMVQLIPTGRFGLPNFMVPWT